MKNRIGIARVLLTVPAVFLSVAPLAADLNESHVLNPLWIGHARLHTVWLLSTNSLIALLSLWVLWGQSSWPPRTAVLLGAGLTGSILAGFFVAAATQSAYGGSLTDPNGIAMTVGPFDANLAVFSVLFCVVAAAALLARKNQDP